MLTQNKLNIQALLFVLETSKLSQYSPGSILDTHLTSEQRLSSSKMDFLSSLIPYKQVEESDSFAKAKEADLLPKFSKKLPQQPPIMVYTLLKSESEKEPLENKSSKRSSTSSNDGEAIAADHSKTEVVSSASSSTEPKISG